MIQVAVGILFNHKGEVLIAQRQAHQIGSGLWEFPGGKVEPHESILQALVREFLEEIGIHVVTAVPWFGFQYDYPERSVFLDAWFIKQFTGEPFGAEGKAIRWVLPQSLEQFQFPEGNHVFIEQLLAFSNMS